MICLHPKKPHENQNLNSTPPKSVVVEEQVVCRYCKYLLQGALLGDCRVSRLIGSGAFGDVYEAEQLPPLSRRVAIKVMSHDRVADGQAAELFAREVGAISALDHPNILPVLRVGSLEDGRSYLVMKYAAHGSLQNYCELTPQNLSILPPIMPANVLDSPDALKANSNANTVDMTDVVGENAIESTHDEEETATSVAVKAQKTASVVADEVKPETPLSHESSALTPRQMLPYVESAAAALQYAHDHGIIHLDVKPANLLLDAEDRLLLADFGVSALLEGYTHASLQGYVGTPLYTAPEQWLEQPRAASDQYALAVTCYQLLTGRAPFTGNLYSIMHGHISTPPPSLRQFQPLIPSEVEEVILQALAKEPTNRYKDMQTFARAYRTAVESSASSQTDAHEQHYTTEVITQELELKTGIEEVQTNISTSGQADATPVPVPTPVQQEASNRGVLQTLSQSAIAVDEAVRETSKGGSEQEIEGRLSGEKVHPNKKNWRRSGLLVLLALLLVASSMVGIIWFTNSCLLGICPAMALNTHNVLFHNSDSQQVTILNTGRADLHWTVSLVSNVTWLRFSPQ